MRNHSSGSMQRCQHSVKCGHLQPRAATATVIWIRHIDCDMPWFQFSQCGILCHNNFGIIITIIDKRQIEYCTGFAKFLWDKYYLVPHCESRFCLQSCFLMECRQNWTCCPTSLPTHCFLIRVCSNNSITANYLLPQEISPFCHSAKIICLVCKTYC